MIVFRQIASDYQTRASEVLFTTSTTPIEHLQKKLLHLIQHIHHIRLQLLEPRPLKLANILTPSRSSGLAITSLLRKGCRLARKSSLLRAGRLLTGATSLWGPKTRGLYRRFHGRLVQARGTSRSLEGRNPLEGGASIFIDRRAAGQRSFDCRPRRSIPGRRSRRSWVPSRESILVGSRQRRSRLTAKSDLLARNEKLELRRRVVIEPLQEAFHHQDLEELVPISTQESLDEDLKLIREGRLVKC
jgi:hypothetical protein